MEFVSASTGLRPYQRELLRKVLAALEITDRPVMMQLPTGGGKTVIAAHLLRDYLTGRRKAVWLTHRKELASQTENVLRKEGIEARFVRNWQTGTKAPKIDAGIVILMVQTVGRRITAAERAKTEIVWDAYGSNDLMIIDEAHHATASSWERAIRQWPGKVLGMTATPWRLSKKEGFDKLFGDLVLGPQVRELQAEGFLCQAQVLWPDEGDRILGGKVDRKGDYTRKGIMAANANNREVMTSRAFKFWKGHAAHRQTIIYAVSVGHARNLMDIYQWENIQAEVILGDTDPALRADAIRDFTDGELKVLINVDVATEGFDLPDASCIVIARPTKSLSLYLQMVGRGLRPKKDGGCIILDLANNRLEHGLPEDIREWSLTAWGGTEGETPPMVLCEKCQTTSPAASHSCKSCGAPFGKDCPRCGKWRAFNSGWAIEELCSFSHDPVCDYCHADAHERAKLPQISASQYLQRLAKANPDSATGDFLYENPAIVTRAVLTALGKAVDGIEETFVAIHVTAGILYEMEGERLNLVLNFEDLHEAIDSSELKDLTKLEVPERWRTVLRFVYQDTSSYSNLRSKISQAHQRLQKSGHCDPNSPRGICRLTQSGREMAKNIMLQPPKGGE